MLLSQGNQRLDWTEALAIFLVKSVLSLELIEKLEQSWQDEMRIWFEVQAIYFMEGARMTRS